MASITRVLAQAADGLVSLSYVYDDINLRVQSFRVLNQTPRPALARLVYTPTGLTYERTVPADTDISVSVPQTPQQRLQLRLVNGRLDDVEITLIWPSDA